MSIVTKKAIAVVGMTTAAASISFAATAHAWSAENLPVTDDIRAQLVETGADLLHQPVSAFSGLVAGKTFYAYDPATQTHWAAAHLAPTTYQAGVADQDQNSYLIYRQPDGAPWVPYADGWGINPCPIPKSVLDVWQWPAGQCRPGGAQGA